MNELTVREEFEIIVEYGYPKIEGVHDYRYEVVSSVDGRKLETDIGLDFFYNTDAEIALKKINLMLKTEEKRRKALNPSRFRQKRGLFPKKRKLPVITSTFSEIGNESQPPGYTLHR